VSVRTDHDPDGDLPDAILFDLEKQWHLVSRLVYPRDVSAVQLQECKRAFYAGAMAVVSVNLRIDDDDVSEERGMEIRDSLMKQVQHFNELLRRGRA